MPTAMMGIQKCLPFDWISNIEVALKCFSPSANTAAMAAFKGVVCRYYWDLEQKWRLYSIHDCVLSMYNENKNNCGFVTIE